MFPDRFSIVSHLGGSGHSMDSSLVVQTMINGIQDMFRRRTITAQEDRIARLASEDEARAARLHFEADIKALLQNSPPEPEPVQLTHTASLNHGVIPQIIPPVYETSPLALPVGHYYLPPQPRRHRDRRISPTVLSFP
jgi:hypothetical protein